MLFQKKAPKGIVGDEGGPGEKAKIPVAKGKKPMKKKGKKPAKHSAPKEGQKGKIASMLGSKFAGKDIAFKGKGKSCACGECQDGCSGECSCCTSGHGKYPSGGAGQTSRFVPQQGRMGIRG
jgi:hypothetical protein